MSVSLFTGCEHPHNEGLHRGPRLGTQLCVIRLHSVRSVGYFATEARQWSPTPLCGLRHCVIRWFVQDRWVVIDPRVSSRSFSVKNLCFTYALCYMSFSCRCRTLLPFTCPDDFSLSVACTRALQIPRF